MFESRLIHSLRPALLAALLVAVASLAGAQQAGSVPDERLQAAVERQIDKKDLRQVTVAVKDGVVTLAGTVPHLYAKNQAAEAARKTKGVVSVVNEVAVEKGESDQLIAEIVAGQVRRYSRYTVFDDVMVAVKAGNVLIGGAVTSPEKVKEINDIASRVAGVQDVRNVMTVLPLSPSDEQLRYTIANSIYGDPMFQQYSMQVNPPIHIIVANGRVVLTGAVMTQLEKQKAEMVVRSTFGVFSVENRLRTER